LDEQEEKEFLKMIGLKGTVPVLKFLNEKGEAHHGDFAHLVNVVSLNTRLRQLLRFGLIEHHLERIETRREWYSITDKGRKILNRLNEILELINSE